jgi:hypothetical protein
MKRQAAPGKAWDDMSLMERLEDGKYIAFFPALTLMVFVRDKPGYRTMNGGFLFAMSAIMGFIEGLFPGSLLGYYAMGMLALGSWRRSQGWKALNDGERLHTRSFGEPYLARLSYWPPFVFKENRFQRIWEPLTYFLFGWQVVMRFDPALGAWIAFSGVCLHFIEQIQYENGVTHTLNTLDGIVESGIHEENVRHFSDDSPSMLNVTSAPRMNTAGTATGIGDDIAAQVARRKQYDAAKIAEQEAQSGAMPGTDAVGSA